MIHEIEQDLLCKCEHCSDCISNILTLTFLCMTSLLMTLTPYLLILSLKHSLQLSLEGLLFLLCVLPTLGHLLQGLCVRLLQCNASAGLGSDELVQLELLLLLSYFPCLQK